VADAAARVLVHLLDQLPDAARAVSDHLARRAARRGDEFAVDDKQSVVVPVQQRLDDD
jgi:hypothetical protein